MKSNNQLELHGPEVYPDAYRNRVLEEYLEMGEHYNIIFRVPQLNGAYYNWAVVNTVDSANRHAQQVGLTIVDGDFQPRKGGSLRGMMDKGEWRPDGYGLYLRDQGRMLDLGVAVLTLYAGRKIVRNIH